MGERKPWTAEEKRRVAEMWCVFDWPSRKIALELDRSNSATFRLIQKMDLKGEKGNPVAYEAAFQAKKVEPTIRPVVVKCEKPSELSSDRIEHVSLHWSDVHFPFQDDRALGVLKQIAGDVNPSIMVDHGDLYDFWQLSSHRPPDEKKLGIDQIDLQEQINEGSKFLGEMLSITKPDRAIFMGGNHEDRWNRLLLEMKKDFRMRHLLSIDALDELLTFERVSGIQDMGWEYYPYREHGDPVVLFDRLVLAHGDLTNKWVTRSMIDKYGHSVMFGHVHRIQNFTNRTLKGQEAGWMIGCLCDINPHYMSFSDWHQGFAVVDWFQGEDGEWLFNVEQVRIHDGKAIFRGRMYQ